MMTPGQLKTLIESDAEALQLGRSGAADLCAKRCMVIAPKVRVSKMLTERGLYAGLGASSIQLDMLNALIGIKDNTEEIPPI